MRISDWSSDVCSSDLVVLRLVLVAQGGGVAVAGVRGGDHGLADVPGLVAAGDLELGQGEQRARAGTALERARGVGDGLQVLRHGELGLVAQADDQHARRGDAGRSEEKTSELQSLM